MGMSFLRGPPDWLLSFWEHGHPDMNRLGRLPRGGYVGAAGREPLAHHRSGCCLPTGKRRGDVDGLMV